MGAIKINTETTLEFARMFIEHTMLQAEEIVTDAADEHLHGFKRQMQELFGEEIEFDEPYLPAELAKFQLQFLKTMDRILGTIERRLSGKKEDDTLLNHKKFDFKQPILPQLVERVDDEIERLNIRIHRALDGQRQQAVGITQ